MKIAVQQMSSVPADVEGNLIRVREAAARARESSVDLLVVPELALTGYGAGDSFATLAETPDGHQAQTLQAIAREHDLAIVCGFAEVDGSALYNSALFVDAGGARLCYRKCQIWGDYEREYFTAAPPSARIVDYHGLRIGVLICYDVEFPERVRNLALAGADLIVVPTATPAGTTSAFISRQMLRVRAFESQVFIAYANHHSHDGRFEYAGLSTIVAPDAEVLALAAADSDELLVADIDISMIKAAREANTYLKDVVP